MNIDYLKNVILPQRNKEIEEGINEYTPNPIYVVLNLQDFIVSGYTDFTTEATNLKEKQCEFGYIDINKDFPERKFKKTIKGLNKPIKVTKIYYDEIVAFFLTHKAAEDYIKSQKHNLVNPYIYIFSIGYQNKEMLNLFNK